MALYPTARGDTDAPRVNRHIDRDDPDCNGGVARSFGSLCSRGGLSRRFEPGCRHLRGFREAILILRLERSKNELSEQLQAADIAIIEAKDLRGERFQQPDYASPAAERHCHHGTRSQATAGVQIHAWINLSIVTAHDLGSAEARSREG